MNAADLLRRPRTWFVAVPVLVLVVALVGPFVWFRVVKDNPPAELSFDDVVTTTTRPLVGEAPLAPAIVATSVAPATTSTIAAAPRATPTTARVAAPQAGPVDGTWAVGANSIAGYRIGETVGLTRQDAVGRTNKVTGAMVISGTTVTSGNWTVDMVSVKSDDERRDENYRRNMAVETYPTSRFVLGEAVNFGSVPPDGTDVTVPIKGALTLRGQTRDVSFSLKARRANNRVEVVGSIRVVFADYGIPNPSNGYARTDDHGLVEFLLLFERQ